MSAFIFMAVFTTSGTFMLLFIAGLQQINAEVEEAAMTDGANGWQRFRYVQLPMLKPVVFTVVTLGLIGTWQIFEQIYTGTQGGPGEDDADARLPVVQRGLQQPGMAARRGHRLHSVCDHRGPHRASAVVAGAVGGGTVSARRERALAWAPFVVLIVLAIIYIAPFLIQIVNSFRPDAEVVREPLSLGLGTWTAAAYERLFTRSDFPLWTMNSFIVTICVTLGRVFFVSLAGYALARIPFRGRGLVYAMLIAIMAVPGVVLLIPKFLVINQLGMYDSYSGMIIPLIADAAGIFIMKNFFESIPVAVEEQARIDGAGVFRTFWSIVLPMVARPSWSSSSCRSRDRGTS